MFVPHLLQVAEGEGCSCCRSVEYRTQGNSAGPFIANYCSSNRITGHAATQATVTAGYHKDNGTRKNLQISHHLFCYASVLLIKHLERHWELEASRKRSEFSIKSNDTRNSALSVLLLFRHNATKTSASKFP